jgi:hypothetical protein
MPTPIIENREAWYICVPNQFRVMGWDTWTKGPDDVGEQLRELTQPGGISFGHMKVVRMSDVEAMTRNHINVPVWELNSPGRNVNFPLCPADSTT